ncbi:Cytochrome bd ubiquinol oxidase, subunit I, partial [mine drainage metagenome]
VLPTWMSASRHSVAYMVFSLIGFFGLYSIFIVIELYLLVRAIRLGPAEPGGHGMLAGPTVPAAAYGAKAQG